jgi:hypothetical protein
MYLMKNKSKSTLKASSMNDWMMINMNATISEDLNATRCVKHRCSDAKGFRHINVLSESLNTMWLPKGNTRLHLTVRIYISMAMQPLVGPWQLFQFLNPIHSR